MKRVKLGEVATIHSGTTPSSGNTAFWGGKNVWITPTDLGKLDGYEIKTAIRKITDVGVASCNPPLIPARSIVMSSRAPIGHLGIATCDLRTNQGCKSFVCGDLLHPEFLYFTLQHRMSDIQALGNGATFLEVSKNALLQFEISLPDLSTQRRIAAKLKSQLDAVEAARAAACGQLADAKRLVPVLLAEAFKVTDSAKRVRIGDVAKTTRGSTPARGNMDYWGTPELPWVKTGEVVFKPIYKTEEAISKRALAECSLSLLPPKTVLIAMYGQGKTRGQSAVLEVAASTNQACFAILPSEQQHPEYLQLWLRHSYGALRELSESRGGNQSNLNGAILNAFEIPLPPIEQQKAIAKDIQLALDQAATIRKSIETQLEEIEQLPKRLLARAFDGKA